MRAVHIMPRMSSYTRNAGAVFSLKYHIVFCPKYRRPVLVGDIETRLRQLICRKAEDLGMTIHAFEIMPDHVHLFLEADPTQCVAEIVNRIKGFTSHELRREFASLTTRLPTLWSRSYFAGTVGSVTAEAVRRYIENQKGK